MSINPWNGEEILRLLEASSADIEQTLSARHAEFARWSPVAMLPERRRRLEHFAAILSQERPAIVELLIREAGKVRLDAEAEADLLPRKIAITLGEGLARTPLQGPGPVRFRPRGLALCLGPFNFPLHLLHGLVVPALAVGCTVIAKPSERCPALGALYAELAAAAGLERVLTVLPGGHQVARALVADARVTTVAAVGSHAMGLALAGLLAQRPQAVLALELGGVNQALVLDDAELASAAVMIADGAWRMAGQRCTATRIVHVPRAQLSPLCELLQRERQRWLPGAGPQALAGPMISRGERERFQAPYRVLPGALRLLAGSPHAPEHSSAAEPLLLVAEQPAARGSELYHSEHFGPALIVDPYDELPDCLARMAANPYRLAASVFSAQRARFEACAEQLPYGLVNWNRPTAGARSELPFGGCGLSGNGRPAAVAAGALFCDETVVVA